jgi:hypothetical protein
MKIYTKTQSANCIKRRKQLEYLEKYKKLLLNLKRSASMSLQTKLRYSLSREKEEEP